MSDSQEPESWDDEFELDDPGPSTSRPRADIHDDDDNDFGAWGDEDEDRTLTARSKPARAPTPPPPVPPLPAGLQSPVPSVFSSGSNNNSTTHLRPTISRSSAARASVGFANLPPSPPIHHERRRLKKKSRPPHEGVYEMHEYTASEEDDLPATTTPVGSPPTGSPLLQRIGSVKSRFSAKKKRTSSTPSEVMLQEDTTPRPSTPPNQSKAWFFRPQDSDPHQSPKLNKRKSFGIIRKSDLPPDLEAELASNHDKYNGLGLGRAGDDRERSRERDHEGSRSWMGNMRRISMGAKHKRGMSVNSGDTPPPLLPPIELRPPSPMMDVSHTLSGSDDTMYTATSGSSASPTRKTSGPQTSLIATASLGRTTTATISNGSAVPRRNSLGDLKIPARISQAQVGLRRDLTLVREFAKNVDELKDLQSVHTDLMAQYQAIIASSPPPPAPRAVSPSIFRPRSRSNTTTRPTTLQALTTDFHSINSKYRVAWECAELLVELGGGTPSPPTTSMSAPVMPTSTSEPPNTKNNLKNRERAITLSGDDRERDNATPTPPPIPAQPPPASWRASTGRNDLSHRQLLLLRDMLNPPASVPEESVNRDWRWGDAMSSTVTLPSEESGAAPDVTPVAKDKKRRSSRMGMSGIRDMLKSLKRQGNGNGNASSSTSVSTNASGDSYRRDGLPHSSKVPTYGRRRAKTSSGPELMDPASRPTTPYPNASLSSLNRPSPRRPSLASIFRIGRSGGGGSSSSKNSMAEASRTNLAEASRSNLDLDLHPTSSGSSGGRDDWDHMEDDFNLGSGSAAGDTIRVRRGRGALFVDETQSPRGDEPRRGADESQSRRGPPFVFVDENRLSNVEEEGAGKGAGALPSDLAAALKGMGTSPKLAMTPENIKPLLENAREVKRRLGDCVEEMRVLLNVHR